MPLSRAPQIDLLDTLRAERRLPTPRVAKAIRQSAGATQQQVADEIGVDRVTVTRWENGVRRPRGQSAVRYGELLSALAQLSQGPEVLIHARSERI